MHTRYAFTTLVVLLSAMLGCGKNAPTEGTPPAAPPKAADPVVSPTPRASNPTTVPQPPQPVPPAKPDFTLTVDQLTQTYKEDPKAAALKYTGKVLRLEGKVFGIGLSTTKDYVILADGSNGGNAVRVVHCHPLRESDIPPRDLIIDKTITVQGVYQGVLKTDYAIELKDCLINPK